MFLISLNEQNYSFYFSFFKQYLVNLSESVKSSSLKEIERAHHLLAIENVTSLCNNKNLSEFEKKEILNRFNKYIHKNVIQFID